MILACFKCNVNRDFRVKYLFFETNTFELLSVIIGVSDYVLIRLSNNDSALTLLLVIENKTVYE